MKFYDDEPVQCDACGDLVYAGSSYQFIKIRGITYKCCNNEDCMSKLLFNFYEDEFQEVYLNTAEDKECIYGDMEYDRRKDEEDG